MKNKVPLRKNINKNNRSIIKKSLDQSIISLGIKLKPSEIEKNIVKVD